MYVNGQTRILRPLPHPAHYWNLVEERKWSEITCKLVFMSANVDSSHFCMEWRMGHFVLNLWNSFMLCMFFHPITVPLHGRGLDRCLNFWGVGIGLLLWEVGGLGLPFSCVPSLCSLGDHFPLLSVHKYKKKKNVHMYKFLRSCANI